MVNGEFHISSVDVSGLIATLEMMLEQVKSAAYEGDIRNASWSNSTDDIDFSFDIYYIEDEPLIGYKDCEYYD